MKTLLSIAATAAFLAFTSFSPNVASASETVATGTFGGTNNHVTTGEVSIVKTPNGGAVVILDSDFNLDGAPDPSVGFGKDGEYVAAASLGELGEHSGLQVFVVPDSVNVEDFNEIYIWCDEFSVSLGVATLKTSTH